VRESIARTRRVSLWTASIYQLTLRLHLFNYQKE
jgi:hypothetical protein